MSDKIWVVRLEPARILFSTFSIFDMDCFRHFISATFSSSAFGSSRFSKFGVYFFDIKCLRHLLFPTFSIFNSLFFFHLYVPNASDTIDDRPSLCCQRVPDDTFFTVDNMRLEAGDMEAFLIDVLSGAPRVACIGYSRRFTG